MITQLKYEYDLPRIIFGTLFIATMIIVSIWVIQPFIPGLAWAAMVVITTWPLLIKLQKILWGKRSLAVIIMTLLLILLFILPISLMIVSLISNSGFVIAWTNTLSKMHMPDLMWLQSLPMFGDKIYNSYHILLNTGGSAILARVQPYFVQTATWFVTQAIHIGRLLLDCTLMLLFSVILYARGEQVSCSIRHFAVRLGAERGDAAVLIGGQAIRAVALGVVVTALVQAVLGWISLVLSGIPVVTWLTLLIFICCLAQLGPLPVLVPVIIWLYWGGENTWATVLVIWSCMAAALDNVLRPILIRMEADLPTILILLGVIGGILAFGLIGLFIGPVVLAVSYRLLTIWIDEIANPSTVLPNS
ncbi:putative membrane protein [Serratia symbiotica str. 'Cinara cedri']|nr:putative membrane protein [Serratia symbiotica str. 'Cinara cedri']